jgi:hypothetical protein
MAGIGTLGGKTMSGASSALDQAIKTQDQPLTDVNTKREEYQKFIENKNAKDSNDPKAPESEVMRQSLRDLGIKVPDTLTAAMGNKMFTAVAKTKEFQIAQETNRLKIKELAQNAQIARESAQGVTQDNRNDREVGTYRDKMLGLSKSGHIKNQWEKMDAVEHALGLIKLHTKAGNTKLTPQEAFELQMALANALANGGHATDATLKHLSPPSAPISLAGAINAITGGSTTIGGGGFQQQVNRLRHNLQNQAQISADIIKKAGHAAQHRDPEISKLQQDVLDKALSEYSESIPTNPNTKTPSLEQVSQFSKLHNVTSEQATQILTKRMNP